jgi:hypothetical protein
VPLNKYTNNFTTPLETNSITGLSPTFGSDNPVLNIGAPEVNINGNELNVVSRNINFSHTTGLTTFGGSVKIGTTQPGAILDINGTLKVSGISTFIDGPIFIGSATSTGTASQTLQVTGGAYVSGNLGIGTTIPRAKLEILDGILRVGYRNIGNPHPNPSNITSYGSIVAGVNTAFNSHFAAVGLGSTNSELAIYSFYPNFANYPSDPQPRRAADIIAGFSTLTWGTEYLAFNVGNNGVPNDVGALTLERVRIDQTGVGIGTTIPRAYLHLNSGTVSPNTAPLKFSAGTNLTGIETGAVEFDGTTLNFTPNGSIGRAAIPITVYTSGQGTVLTAGSEATNQVLFPTANDTINLPVGTYYLDLNMAVQRGTTSTTSSQLRLRFGGTGTLSAQFSGISVGSVIGQLGSGAGITSSFLLSSVTMTNDTIIGVAATTPLATYVSTVSGILRVTTAGSFSPQYSLSANLTSAGTAASPSTMNHMVIRSLATSGSVANVGLWT